MTKLQKIVNKAKALRKAQPKKYAKWTDYIKAASKSLSGLDSVKRAGNKTTVNYTKKTAVKKKAVPKKAVQAKLFGVKKVAPKKRPAAHKDTKSHNVNIKVVSGVDNFGISQLRLIANEILKREKAVQYMQPVTKYPVNERPAAKKYIKYNKEKIANLKKQITLIKKSIK